MKKLAIVGVVLLSAACSKMGQGPGCGGVRPAFAPPVEQPRPAETPSVKAGKPVQDGAPAVALDAAVALQPTKRAATGRAAGSPKMTDEEIKRRREEARDAFLERERRMQKMAEDLKNIRKGLGESDERLSYLESERKKFEQDPNGFEELRRVEREIVDEQAFREDLLRRKKEVDADDVHSYLAKRPNVHLGMPFGKSSFGPWSTGGEPIRP